MPKLTNYSKVTKKGQITIPARLRKEYSVKPGSTVSFESRGEFLAIRPVKDMESSAGSLSKYAKAKDILKELISKRETESFR